jgi:peroxiredoxin
MTHVLLVLVVGFQVSPAYLAADRLEDKSRDRESDPKREYTSIIQEYEGANRAREKEVEEAKSPQDKGRVYVDHAHDWDEFGRRMLALAERHPRDPVAVDALVWVMRTATAPRDRSRRGAMAILARDHVSSDKLADIFESNLIPADAEWQAYLRTLLEKNPYKNIRGRACLALALSLQNPLLFDRTGAPSTGCKINKEIEILLERAVREFGDVDTPFFGTVGKKADGILFEERSLVVGKESPELEGADHDGRLLKLSEYRGKVVLVLFWESTLYAYSDMLPNVRGLVKRYGGRPFAVLGISEDNEEILGKFVTDGKVNWRSICDGGSNRRSIATKWNLNGLPTLYLIDRKGIIRRKWYGVQDRATLERSIEQFIGEIDNSKK